MKQGMNIKQKIVVAIMDVFILAELIVSIYIGHQDPENVTALFLKIYAPALLITVLVGRICIRRLGAAPAGA
jgi:hypothetical protein